MINSGSGTGLTLDYSTAHKQIWYCWSVQLQTSGSQYASGGTSVSVAGVPGSMLVDFTTNTYVPGITSSISINNDGTSYTSGSNVASTGGNGNGLTFDPIASDYNQVISLSEIDDGTNYTTGVAFTNCNIMVQHCSRYNYVGPFTGSIFGYDILAGGDWLFHRRHNVNQWRRWRR